MTFYKIHAKADDHAEILIYDEIGKADWFNPDAVDAKAFTEELDALNVSSITLRINSPGGSVFEGSAIFNAIQRHKATVTTHVDGIAASVASIVALAGDKVIMAKNALMMIHNPWALAVGDAREMRKTADLLDKSASTLIGVYTEKSGMSVEDVSAAMAEETWYTAEEAVAAGLADEIAVDETADVKAIAQFNPKALQQFRHAPAQVAALLRGDDPAPAPAEVPAPKVDASTPAGSICAEATAARVQRVRELITER